jgi:hypothetical protein
MRMDRNEKQIQARETARLDEILATEEALLPSSGFLAAVMENVEREARAMPPIPFPWKRAIPGIVLAVVVFGWSAVELVRLVVAAMKQGSLAAPHVPPGLVQPMEQVGWVALALGLSLGSWLLARRFAGQSGLL